MTKSSVFVALIVTIGIFLMGCGGDEPATPEPSITIEDFTYTNEGRVVVGARLAGYEGNDVGYPADGCLTLRIWGFLHIPQ